MAVVGFVAYFTIQDVWQAILYIFIGAVVISAWVLFFMDTYCDVVPIGKTKPCGNPAYGKIGSCYLHRREKWDAIFAVIGLRNPGSAFRVAWQSPSYGPAKVTYRGISVNVTRNDASQAILLIFTIVGVTAQVITVPPMIILK